MARLLALSFLLVLVIPAGVAAQYLTEAEIVRAIKMGKDGDFNALISDCTAGPSFGTAFGGFGKGFDVVTSGAAGRIARAAFDGKRKYMTLTPETVPDELLIQQLFVSAEPDDPDTDDRAPMIEHIVLKAKEKPQTVLQPESIETEPVEWDNLFGGEWKSNRAVAVFLLEAAKDLTPGDVDVALITTAGEFRCKIGKKDRARLFPPNR